MSHRSGPVPARTYWKTANPLGESSRGDETDLADDGRNQCSETEANLISSLTESGMHAPAIDLDLPCRLIPSSTPGHFHLYIDKEITWEKYQLLLRGFIDAGIIELGFHDLAMKRGATFLRHNCVKGDGK